MDQRWIAIGTSAVGAVLLAVGALTKFWLVGDAPYGAGSVDIGLRSLTVCSFDQCESGVLGQFSLGDLHQVKTLGLITLLLGLASGVSVLGSAALGYFGKAANWFMAPSTIAITLCAISLIVGVIALVSFQGRVTDLNVGTGISFILFGLGATAGLTGAILVGRFPREDEDFFEPPFDTV